MLNPVVVQELSVPAASIPVSAGASVQTAPATAVSVLSPLLETYSCAVIVPVVPISDLAVAVLKRAEMEVTVPARGKT